eukprot:1117137-Pyramimonas_sp.AAC.1
MVGLLEPWARPRSRSRLSFSKRGYRKNKLLNTTTKLTRPINDDNCLEYAESLSTLCGAAHSQHGGMHSQRRGALSFLRVEHLGEIGTYSRRLPITGDQD